MKNYTIKTVVREQALLKMELSPYSLIGDSISYRAGYIRALQDLGLTDGLSAVRMLMKVEAMDWRR